MRSFPVLIALVLCAVHPSVRPCSADSADPAERFVDHETVAVVRVDLARVDLGALRDWIARDVRPHEAVKGRHSQGILEEVDKLIAQMQPVLLLLRESGNQLTVISSMSQLDGPAAVFHVSPDKKHGPAKAALESLAPGSVVAVEDDHVILDLQGGTAARRLAGMRPSPRPEVWQALASAGDAPIRAAFCPTPAMRQLMQDAVPTLPPELGNESTDKYAQGLQWATAALALPPGSGIDTRVIADDPQTAHAAAEVLRKAAHVIAERLRTPALADVLVFTVEGNAVRLSVDRATADRRLIEPMVAIVVQAEENARRIRSASNMRMIGQAIYLYSNDHNGGFPNSLDDPQLAAMLNESVMRIPGAAPGRDRYVYLPPTVDMETALRENSQRLLMHEPFDKDSDAVNVLFLDGHVESMTGERAQSLIDEAREEDEE